MQAEIEEKLNQFRNFAVWIVIAVLLVALFSLFQSQSMHMGNKDLTYSELFKKVD